MLTDLDVGIERPELAGDIAANLGLWIKTDTYFKFLTTDDALKGYIRSIDLLKFGKHLSHTEMLMVDFTILNCIRKGGILYRIHPAIVAGFLTALFFGVLCGLGSVFFILYGTQLAISFRSGLPPLVISTAFIGIFVVSYRIAERRRVRNFFKVCKAATTSVKKIYEEALKREKEHKETMSRIRSDISMIQVVIERNKHIKI